MAVRGGLELLVAGVVWMSACHRGPVQAPVVAAAEPAPAAPAAPVPADTSPKPPDEAALQAAIARDLGDARAWEGLAWAYYQRSAEEPGYGLLAGQVVAQGLAALARSGRTSADLVVTRGLLALAEGRPDAARRDLEAALVLAPHHKRALLTVGQLALATRDHARARRALELLADLRSGRTDPEVWLALGAAEWGLKDTAAAEAAYQQATLLAPEDPRPHYNLGLLYFRRGELDDVEFAVRGRLQHLAETHVREFLRLAADDPRYATARGLAEAQLAALSGGGCEIGKVRRLDREFAAEEEARRLAEEPERQRARELEQATLAEDAAAPVR